MQAIRRFRRDRSGATAVLFGLTLVPAMGLAGVALDYARAASARSAIQNAVDATALALVRDPASTGAGQLQAKGEAQFRALVQGHRGLAIDAVTVRRDSKTVRVAAAGRVQASLMRVFGFEDIAVGSDAAVAWGGKSIELALVLDNTGSMNHANKLPELKIAVGKLLDDLKAASQVRGDVKVAVVPFNTQVQIGTGYREAPWLRYDTTLENPDLRRLRLDPSPPSSDSWTGCVSDRDQRYDASSEPPSGMLQTRYVAARCHFAPLAPMRPLSADLEDIRGGVNAMQAAGATNVTIGLTTGLATLRSDSPLGAGSSDAGNVEKFLVLLTDGNNTQNRWGGDGSEGNPFVGEIDARLRVACQAAKGGRVRIFTIRVIEGNADLLRSCASDASMYHEVSSAAQLQPVFKEITRAMTATRLTH